MKFFHGILSCGLILSLVLVGTARAEQRAEAITFSPLVGYHLFEGDQSADDGVSGGFALGYNLNQRWTVELDGRYTPTEVERSGSGNSDLDVWTFGLNALYHFNPEGRLVPYVLAGFGGMAFVAEDFPDDEDFMMNWGLGAKYDLTANTALRVDARHLLDFHSDRAFDHLGHEDETDHNLIASVGLTWQFGGVAAGPAKPSDTDGDGIPDTRDKCPGTPAGTPVDAVGCPPVSQAAPAPAPKISDGDNDQDGVLNSRDKCPGTPVGTIVDEHGCPIKYTLRIEFDFDRAEVRPEYHDELRRAAEFIRKHPGTRFLLAGHTDSIGSAAYNKGLSRQRAVAVKVYLMKEFGIAAQRLQPRGYGEERPVASNATEVGRQENRRVEIVCCIEIPAE